MRQSYKLFAASILIVAITSAATAALTAPAEQISRIEMDRKTGALLFIVNGREEARINATGLHVRQDVEYGHTIMDSGETNYIGINEKAPHAP